jgi:hypothetical protein
MPPGKTTTKKAATKRTVTRVTDMPDKLRATETFAIVVDDDVLLVHRGEVVSADHAVVKRRKHLFEPADVHVDHE